MLKICPRYAYRYARDMPKIFSIIAQDIPMILPRNSLINDAQEMPMVCSRYALDMPERCPRYVQKMTKKLLRFDQDMTKICQSPAQDMLNICSIY